MKRRVAEAWASWLEGNDTGEAAVAFDGFDSKLVETLQADLKIDSLLMAKARMFDVSDEERFVAAVLSKAGRVRGALRPDAVREGRQRRSRRAGVIAAILITVMGISAAAMWYARRIRPPESKGESALLLPSPAGSHARGPRTLSSVPSDAPTNAAERLPPVAAISRAALVVLGQVPPSAGDRLVLDRLALMGFRTKLRTIGELDVTKDAQVDLVAVSSTVESRDFSAEMRRALSTLAIPLMVWEPWLFEGFGMANCPQNDGCGWLVSGGELNLGKDGKALLETRADTLRIADVPVVVSFGVPKPGALVLASVDSDARREVMFLYEKGAPLTLGPAPARRAALFLSDETARHLTAEGWGIFEAAITWLVEPPDRGKRPIPR